MEIEHNSLVNDLLDIYAPLLTDYQVEIMEYYFKEDLSLKEIAEIKNISRNAVHTLIKRVETLLFEYEAKLKLNEKYRKIEELNIEKNIKKDILDILL